MKTILTIILFILMLTAIISIHEFGHFLAAKLFGVYVYEFSIGMGKKLYQRKGKETTFSIRLLPIGGYCAMVGDTSSSLEEDNEIMKDVDFDSIPPERTLNGIAKWKKIIILLSGVFMNFVLALVIVAMVYLSLGSVYNAPKPIIKEALINYPAYEAGIRNDDYVKEIKYDNGYSLVPENFSDISDFLAIYEKGDITLTVERDGELLEFKVAPVYDESSESYKIGINSYDYDEVKVNIFNCFGFSASYLWLMLKLIWTTLLGLFRGVGLNNLSGPIGIYQATSQAVSYGFSSYILLIAILSLNIGFFNLIPIPALDGGRVVLTIIEAIIRKPIPKKVENFIMTVSVLLFLALMLLATGSDIFKLFTK